MNEPSNEIGTDSVYNCVDHGTIIIFKKKGFCKIDIFAYIIKLVSTVVYRTETIWIDLHITESLQTTLFSIMIVQTEIWIVCDKIADIL